MAANLVIVESPAKAKTIEKFLGKDYVVKSSYGHIRDLAKKNLGIDIEKNYEPQYIVPTDKKKVVTELKQLAKVAERVWLASDEDREGEAIAWHLYEVLKLDPKKTKRIVFHEITKDAILNAINNPRDIDLNLVNAQQARRVLDRLVGFELSPILWKKVRTNLSAGRVQSVSVRLIVEREREINDFISEPYYRVNAIFSFEGPNKKITEISMVLDQKFDKESDANAFLNHCINAEFKIGDISVKPAKKSPSAPFTTSTLQQEASRKLGFSVSQTMTVAQKLYEAGHITYMRTDSVNLSSQAIAATESVIKSQFGDKYHEVRNFKTKSKGAQEAHEAIRPTYLENKSIDGNNSEKRLYNLIWQRTIASQMSDAQIEKTVIRADVSESKYTFSTTGEVLKFDGFLRVYSNISEEDENQETAGLLPPIKVNTILSYNSIEAIEKYPNTPPRYTEASLVRKLEELGIGRPSTYAPTISTIQARDYVVKEDRPGKERNVISYKLEKGIIKSQKKTEIFGAEKSKLFPNDIGILVNDFLVTHFEKVLSFNFTANVEEEFDNIAEGKTLWVKMIDGFYKNFHKTVETTLETSERSKGERELGVDPSSGKTVFARIGRYGPIVQIGDNEGEEKPKFASLLKGQLIETITLEEAMELFKLPRELGEYENKKVVVGVGRFGPYVRHDNKFVSLKKGVDDPYSVGLDRAIELINEKRVTEQQKIIKDFAEDKEMHVLNGRYGAYIGYKKKNYKIPKNQKPEELTLEMCKEIVEKSKKK